MSVKSSTISRYNKLYANKLSAHAPSNNSGSSRAEQDFAPGCLVRRRLALLIFTLCLLFSSAQVAGRVLFNRLDHTNGLPQINVVSIYQDETGAMWFGTISGLCRYNGSSTRMFYSSPDYPGLTKNSILQITGNHAGAIYIRTEFDLIRYDLADDTFRVLSNDATGMSFAAGQLWFTSGNRIYTWSEESGAIAFNSTMEEVGGLRIAMAISSGGEVWYGGTGGLSVDSRKILETDFVYSLFIDSTGLVWAGTKDNGLYALYPDGSVHQHFRHTRGDNGISDNFIRTIAEDEEGVIWVGTSMGLDSFDKSTGEWKNYAPDETHPGSLSDHSVFAIYRDAQNTMWIGTYYGGVNYFNSRRDVFRYYRASTSYPDQLSYPFVGPMVCDGEGNLWIGTDGGGINHFDRESRRFSRYFYEPYTPEHMPRYHIKSIALDSLSGKLYMGVYGVGLWVFDTHTCSGVLYERGDGAIMSVQHWRGQIIAHTGWEMFRIDTVTDTLVPFSDDEELNRLIGGEYVYRFFIDSGGWIWLSSHSGLSRVNLSTREMREYRYDPAEARAFGKSTVMSFVETSAGELFFSTLGSGLFRYNSATDDFDSFTVANGAQPSDFSYHISELPGGNLLVLHNDSFSIFSPDSGSTVYRSLGNFPLSGFFEGNSSLVTSDGEIFIGGVNGLVSVETADLIDPPAIDYNLYFDRLTVNDAAVRPGDATGILGANLPLTERLRLKHDQNSISVEFAASDYSRHRPALDYEYRMEGLDESWQTASSYTITYTSLPPGSYTLAVRDDSKTARLAIVVRPPWWRSIFAQVIYALLTVAFVAGIVLFFVWRWRMRTRLEMGRREKENIEQLNRTKLAFFTSVSHEFRTPLTLIMAQTENLLSSGGLSEMARGAVGKVYTNASHLRDLISELLDFRKAEAGFQKLRPEPTDLVPYIAEIWQSFSEYAVRHAITYTFDHPDDPVLAAIDRVQFRKAIYNLLSNAFKYTADDGVITVRLRVDEQIRIEIEDNGIGISPEAATRIFERFYQAEYRTSGFSLGTGIGLALTKEIVEGHGGEIAVRSALDRGSVFEISLPLAESETLPAAENEPELPTPPVLPSTSTSYSPPVSPTPSAADGDQSTILIVEDNDELRVLLAGAFAVDYTVLTAANGREGLEKTLEHLPDIVLTDVMMPLMSGRDMCRAIKNDEKLAHIPVVMLTSLDSADETLEGFMFGADDYIAKPFNMEILRARCGAIIRGRRQFFCTAARSRERTPTAVEIRSEQDRIFLDRITAIIYANLDNPDFDMSRLASESGMSRASFYNKVKAISGMTPNEFTLTVRLREAAGLLKNHAHLQVSEIADRLGFYSTKNLSKYFKIFYGVTPSQWRKDNG